MKTKPRPEFVMAIAAAVVLILVMLLSSCSKSEEVQPAADGSVIFYTDDQGIGNYNVIFDGLEYGALKYSDGGPMCGSSGFVTISASAGEHTYDFKSLDGHAWGNPKTVTVISGQCVPVCR